ncbi:MAG: 2-octaprenyl-6-methoxyphenyl hydroxylase [Gammaproteobacteria bacterium]|nr:2-octaprenyl-6-methoxyphenyl hydroxylase [Gammaproteobacteria bacterium]
MSTDPKVCSDVVIAGGGMIGTSLALALAPLGLRVTVVEAIPRQADEQPSFDERSTALSRSTQKMFEAMGLWDEIVAASTPIRSIHVSDQGKFGFSHIDAEEQRVEALGYVVINRVLGSVLQAAIDRLASVEVICPARIVGVDLSPETASVVIEADDGARQTLDGRLLVAADGANSNVREMLGIPSTQAPYGQRAVIGNLRAEKELENRAFERFTPQGPLALLPVSDERAAYVWTVSEDDAERVLALDDETFLDELQREFGYRLGSFSKAGKRSSYPLMLSRAERLTAMRSVLVGNAAHGLHPVSAQGFNLGLRDVAALCDCIADSRRAAECFDPGDAALLARYASWRRSDQKKLVRFTDGLVRLFGSRRRPVGLLRNIGMLGFDLVPGVRSLFAKHTMGLAGKLPRLSRGVPLK